MTVSPLILHDERQSATLTWAIVSNLKLPSQSGPENNAHLNGEIKDLIVIDLVRDFSRFLLEFIAWWPEIEALSEYAHEAWY